MKTNKLTFVTLLSALFVAASAFAPVYAAQNNPRPTKAPTASAADPACCAVTSIAKSGEITAKETKGARTFQFQVADPALRRGLRVGAPVYANFDTKQVSLDGKRPCCKILNISTAAKQPVPGKTPADPRSSDSGLGSAGSSATTATGRRSAELRKGLELTEIGTGYLRATTADDQIRIKFEKPGSATTEYRVGMPIFLLRKKMSPAMAGAISFPIQMERTDTVIKFKKKVAGVTISDGKGKMNTNIVVSLNRGLMIGTTRVWSTSNSMGFSGSVVVQLLDKDQIPINPNGVPIRHGRYGVNANKSRTEHWSEEYPADDLKKVVWIRIAQLHDPQEGKKIQDFIEWGVKVGAMGYGVYKRVSEGGESIPPNTGVGTTPPQMPGPTEPGG